MKYSAHRARSAAKIGERRGIVIFGENLNKKNLDSRGSCVIRVVLFGALFTLALCPASLGQSPNPAASGPAKNNSGAFTPGMTLGAKFEGSNSSDGFVYDLGPAEIGRAHGLNSSHGYISYAVFCLKKKIT